MCSKVQIRSFNLPGIFFANTMLLRRNTFGIALPITHIKGRKSKNRRDQNAIRWFAEHGFEIAEFMEVRMAIEPLAIKLAIERITPKESQELQEIHHKFENALQKNDVSLLIMCDEAFHNTIVKASKNGLLISINKHISDAFFEYRTKAFAVEGKARNALEPHANIVRAIQEKDVEKAQQEMIRHLHISLHDISDAVAMGKNSE